MESRPLAREIHARFSQLLGSQFIASEYAIAGLLSSLAKRQPRAVLEVGSGIGTLTYATIRALSVGHGRSDTGPPFTLICLEDNEFCLAELQKNLSDHRDQFQLFHEIAAAPADAGPFDFVIIDGPIRATEYAARLSRRAVLFVENDRGDQRADLSATIHDRPWVCAYFHPRIHVEVTKGGYWLYQFEPDIRDRLRFGLASTCRFLFQGGYQLLRRGYRLARRMPVSQR